MFPFVALVGLRSHISKIYEIVCNTTGIRASKRGIAEILTKMNAATQVLDMENPESVK